MAIINKLPHPVSIIDKDKNVLATFPSCNELTIYANSNLIHVSEFEGVPISKTIYTYIGSLPDEVEGIKYIVSKSIKSAFPQRNDLLIPAEPLYTYVGTIIGYQSLEE